MAGERDTKIWINGDAVEFVTWTSRELIYTRAGYEDTLIRLPRNTVQRMLKSGALRIEGPRPDWANPDLAENE